jgi:hypothetical protein
LQLEFAQTVHLAEDTLHIGTAQAVSSINQSLFANKQFHIQNDNIKNYLAGYQRSISSSKLAAQ